MIKALFPLLLLAACSSMESLEKKIHGMQPIQMKSIPVASRLEAKKYIQNQRNYLVLLFEQSRDPYYGTPKWNAECLKANKIGEITDTPSYMIFSSRLFLDQQGAAGFCYQDTSIVYGQQVIVYCEGDKVVRDMKFGSPDELDIKKYKLCD